VPWLTEELNLQNKKRNGELYEKGYEKNRRRTPRSVFPLCQQKIRNLSALQWQPQRVRGETEKAESALADRQGGLVI